MSAFAASAHARRFEASFCKLGLPLVGADFPCISSQVCCPLVPSWLAFEACWPRLHPPALTPSPHCPSGLAGVLLHTHTYILACTWWACWAPFCTSQDVFVILLPGDSAAEVSLQSNLDCATTKARDIDLADFCTAEPCGRDVHHMVRAVVGAKNTCLALMPCGTVFHKFDQVPTGEWYMCCRVYLLHPQPESRLHGLLVLRCSC
jgi:hypothetical protein